MTILTHSLRPAFLTGALCVMTYPILWMTLTAFRTDTQVLEHPFAWPEQWQLHNFSEVLATGAFHDPLANGALILLAFVLTAIGIRCLLDFMLFQVHLWHLIPAIAILILCLAITHCPQLHHALLNQPGFANAYLNSVLVTLSSVTLSIMLASLAAYPFALADFPGKNFLFTLLLLGMMIPIHVTLIPLNLLLGSHGLGLKGSLAALIGPYTGFAMPLSILILRTAFRATPKDLIDAARMDGCNAWQIFRHIVLPLARPSLATLLIFNFLTAWNDFAFALTLADSRQPTLPLQLNNFKGEHGSMDVALICAALVIAVAPLLTVYAIAQKHIIRGLTAGAVKE